MLYIAVCVGTYFLYCVCVSVVILDLCSTFSLFFVIDVRGSFE